MLCRATPPFIHRTKTVLRACALGPRRPSSPSRTIPLLTTWLADPSCNALMGCLVPRDRAWNWQGARCPAGRLPPAACRQPPANATAPTQELKGLAGGCRGPHTLDRLTSVHRRRLSPARSPTGATPQQSAMLRGAQRLAGSLLAQAEACVASSSACSSSGAAWEAARGFTSSAAAQRRLYPPTEVPRSADGERSGRLGAGFLEAVCRCSLPPPPPLPPAQTLLACLCLLQPPLAWSGRTS